MKIALLTDGIYPHVIGGMQKHSYYLAKYLARQGVKVDLYHTVPGMTRSPQMEGFSVEELNNITPVFIPHPEIRYFPGHYLRASFLYSERIYHHLIANCADTDFIYAKGFTAWRLLTTRQKKLYCPIGVNFHGYEMFQVAASLKMKLQHLMLRPAVLLNVRNADYAFTYGGKITDIIKNLGVEQRRIIEIPSGIGSEWVSYRFHSLGNPRRFIFVGRYERRKGIQELSAVLREITPQQRFQFDFVGPIPDKLRIRHNKINYHGAVTDASKLRSIVGEYDVLVCPSYSEGMPNVILEAMSQGLAVIATDVGAVSELVSDETGWLISSGDQRQLRQAMIDAINTPDDVLSRKKRAGQALLRERFTWDAIIRQTISEIDKIVGSPENNK
jgi:glycosyltransferase involved in cell wall biosynthesis